MASSHSSLEFFDDFELFDGLDLIRFLSIFNDPLLWIVALGFPVQSSGAAPYSRWLMTSLPRIVELEVFRSRIRVLGYPA